MVRNYIIWLMQMKVYKIIENNINYIILVSDINNIYYHLEIGGLLHREIGPALIFGTGEKEYYLNNIWHSDINTNEEWLIKQIIE